jgi:hypothetical protein
LQNVHCLSHNLYARENLVQTVRIRCHVGSSWRILNLQISPAMNMYCWVTPPAVTILQKRPRSRYIVLSSPARTNREVSGVGDGAVGGDGELGRLDGVALIGSHASAGTWRRFAALPYVFLLLLLSLSLWRRSARGGGGGRMIDGD